jgi:hypothetical protein
MERIWILWAFAEICKNANFYIHTKKRQKSEDHLLHLWLPFIKTHSKKGVSALYQESVKYNTNQYNTGHNSTPQHNVATKLKVAFRWLNQVLCLYQSFWLVDSLVLPKRQPLAAANTENCLNHEIAAKLNPVSFHNISIVSNLVLKTPLIHW